MACNTMRIRSSVVALLCLTSCSASSPQPEGSVITLALVNGRIWTGNASQPDAEAVAIAGDRIVSVGTTADIRARGWK
jgi:hypothetical protein